MNPGITKRSGATLAIWVSAAMLVSGCSLITGVANSCQENPADKSRMCTTVDTSQNITTRTIERDNRLFVSTCSNGNCSEYKEIGAAPTPK